MSLVARLCGIALWSEGQMALPSQHCCFSLFWASVSLRLCLLWFCFWIIFRIKLVSLNYSSINYSVTFTNNQLSYYLLCRQYPLFLWPRLLFYYFFSSPSKMNIFFLAFPLRSLPPEDLPRPQCVGHPGLDWGHIWVLTGQESSSEGSALLAAFWSSRV